MKSLSPYLKVGSISSAHGLKGEVNVYPSTDDPARFQVLKEAFLDTGREMKPLTVEGVHYTKKYAVLKFKECNSVEEAERLKGRDIYVDREHAVELDEDEYFITDLIGLEVFQEDGTKLGVLSDVLTTAANDVYVIDRGQGKEVLIPAVKSCILHVAPEEGTMTVHLMPGMLEE